MTYHFWSWRFKTQKNTITTFNLSIGKTKKSSDFTLLHTKIITSILQQQLKDVNNMTASPLTEWLALLFASKYTTASDFDIREDNARCPSEQLVYRAVAADN
jgi:hypothetical protein